RRRRGLGADRVLVAAPQRRVEAAAVRGGRLRPREPGLRRRLSDRLHLLAGIAATGGVFAACRLAAAEDDPRRLAAAREGAERRAEQCGSGLRRQDLTRNGRRAQQLDAVGQGAVGGVPTLPLYVLRHGR